MSGCRYDAWTAYYGVTVGYLYHGKTTAADVPAARREAISSAAWRLLKERYVFSRAATNYLTIEQGPTKTVQLQYATYYDAADHVGMSRIYGGILPQSDDFPALRAGSLAGLKVWALAQKYFDGSITNSPVLLALRSTGPGTCEINYPSIRGFSYAVQSTEDLTQPFTNEPAGFLRATDTRTSLLDSSPALQKYYRLMRKLTP